MTRPLDAIGPQEVDILQEVATIGCGHALTALGKLMQRQLDMDVPEAWIGAGAGAIADFLGGLGQNLMAVAVQLTGLLSGQLVLVLAERDAERLATVLGYPVNAENWSTLAESAVMESGNIVGSAFVSSIASVIDQKLLLSVPRLARGGGRACLDALVEREVGSVALATRFSSRPPLGIEGLILVMPEPDRVSLLIAAVTSPWNVLKRKN